MSDKEAAVALGECVTGGGPIDAAQLSRWFSGDENPQVWRFHAVPALREAVARHQQRHCRIHRDQCALDIFASQARHLRREVATNAL